MATIYAVSICEGFPNDLHTFNSRLEASAYSEGFSDGAGQYGAGGAYVVTYPFDNNDFDGCEPNLQIKCLKMIPADALVDNDREMLTNV